MNIDAVVSLLLRYTRYERDLVVKQIPVFVEVRFQDCNTFDRTYHDDYLFYRRLHNAPISCLGWPVGIGAVPAHAGIRDKSLNLLHRIVMPEYFTTYFYFLLQPRFILNILKYSIRLLHLYSTKQIFHLRFISFLNPGKFPFSSLLWSGFISFRNSSSSLPARQNSLIILLPSMVWPIFYYFSNIILFGDLLLIVSVQTPIPNFQVDRGFGRIF